MNTPPPPGWCRRHWKWLVAGGCLATLGLFVAAIFGVLALVFGVLRASTPYRHAMQAAQSNPAVILALGDPISPGWLMSGHIDFEDDGSGNAQFTIPLHGSRRDGTLSVRGERINGRWRYSVLSVRIQDSGRRINLLGAPLPQDACRTSNTASCNTIRA